MVAYDVTINKVADTPEDLPGCREQHAAIERYERVNALNSGTPEEETGEETSETPEAEQPSAEDGEVVEDKQPVSEVGVEEAEEKIES